MSIKLEQLEHRYPGTRQGLLGVSIEVARGELLAVIGASGCGKSTLLRLVAGLLPVQSGRLLIDDRDVATVPPWERSVGMVFQSYALFPHLSVLENAAYGLRMRGVAAVERRRTAEAMIESVGLTGLEARRPSQLSGGQQQRVALARALAFRPSVLLLDEPLAALDAHIRAQLCDEIRDIQRASGAATLFVTHDQQEALMMADRVAVLHQGRLQQIDTPRGLYSRPANLMVARFVGHANLLAGTVLEPGRVQTVLGVLHADTGPRLAGAAICVLVRPESIHPDPAPDAPNRIPGAAGRVRFLGSTCRWDFLPALGAQSAVAAQSGLAAAPLPTLFCEGATVASSAVSLSPEALVILDDDAQLL
jgi:putative spermidine/putrescine transport system ATP-binding protein